MLKVECSKYPMEKCQNAENKNLKLCEYCKHNLYQNIGNWNAVPQDHFKRVNE